ncbi:fimbria/pilus periplasmic chaperone [Stenotrophomonas sp. HITSZ_GD]|uniref:fimbrial biogenesis chaperone n=1 Tax=Stenotrophomonas sp. HITSZ_GD TaxID=3037248 RepID=UPI00240E78AA|nr:fimbria/pilus periplasmic chaperone [Stenotrophomonas sp. HITSZ_GD]MDG2526772.1 fimbria/pilus periplasmic chaperone [Stenotrophomonas sp. HITSZ_GD]
MRRLAWLLLALLPAPGRAEGLRVSPITVDLPAEAPQALVRLANEGGAPWPAEARLYVWEQQDDADRLVPATDLAVSPARFEVAAAGEQLLRVVRLGSPPAQAERAYRLVIEQRRGDAAPATGLLRYSAPVFVLPREALPSRPALLAEVLAGRDGPHLRIHNPGPLHARLADLAFVGADGRREPLYADLAGYILPGQARSWALPARVDGYAGGRFLARLNALDETELPAAAAAP